jgi:hypothetical protein
MTDKIYASGSENELGEQQGKKGGRRKRIFARLGGQIPFFT